MLALVLSQAAVAAATSRTAPVGNVADCLKLSVGDPPWDLHTDQQGIPICVDVDILPNVPSVVVYFYQDNVPPQDLCFSVEGDLAFKDPNCTRGHRDPMIYQPLLAPTTPRSYKFHINPAAPSPYDVRVDVRADPSSPFPGGSSPPPPLGACDDWELQVLAVCANDARNLNCPHATSTEELNCLGKHSSHTSPRCRSFLDQLDQCENGQKLLVPMEVASIMLLVTASFTLLCTILRCCCRRFCHPASGTTSAHPSVSLEEPLELSDASEDEESSTGSNLSNGTQPGGGSGTTTSTHGAGARGGTPHAKSKGAACKASPHRATTEGEGAEEEEDLPAYTEVVDDSTLTVQPLQYTTAATAAAGAGAGAAGGAAGAPATPVVQPLQCGSSSTTIN